MKWFKYSLLITSVLASVSSYAGIVVGGTRVVYDGKNREVSLSIKNPETKTPYLIQSWIDNESETDKTKVPFTITPPLFRLDASQENMLRIVNTAAVPVTDRESAYWVNIKSIPSSEKSDKNQLQITVKTRIKLFYRPVALASLKSESAYDTLKFKLSGNQLEATNPSPFYISFYNIKVDGKELKDSGMIAPKSSKTWPVQNGKVITWQAINDFGGVTEPRKVSF